MDFKSTMERELRAARAIAEKADAEGRELTTAEVDAAKAHLAAFKEAKAASEAPKKFGLSHEQMKMFTTGDFDALNVSLGNGTPRGGATNPVGYKSRAKAAWAEEVAKKMQSAMRGPDGSKALTSGTIDVPSVIGSASTIAGRPVSVIDLVQKPEARGSGIGNAFSYLRQSARTNNAGPVVDNATKPTSVYTFGDIESKFSVYAHLSEVFPKRYLDDYNDLIEILREQLAEGLIEALEDDIVAGDGTGDAFTGILNTSGLQVQAWTTDLLTTMSNAKFKAVTTYQQPDAWLLHPTDVQRLELLREGGSTGAFLFSGRSAIEDFIGAPIVATNAITAGVGLLGDWSQVELLVREDDHIDVDMGGDKFAKNQVQLRNEGRYGLKIGRPSAFITVDLTA